MNRDLFKYLFQFINLGDLQNYSRQNKMFYSLYKNNENSIAKKYLNFYNVNYKDPNNFIYKINNQDIQDYKINNCWDYPKLLKLYKTYFYEKHIFCYNKNITSMPIYPNMEKFIGYDNKLSIFPVQPNMLYCQIHYNNLKTFPTQPKMIEITAWKNNLLYFAIQPSMERCYISHNNLKTFHIQPKMKVCDISFNKLQTFPVQPVMTCCNLQNNDISYYQIQPKLINFK